MIEFHPFRTGSTEKRNPDARHYFFQAF